MIEAQAVPGEARFEMLPVKGLLESPTNPRRDTNGDLGELVESVKAKGVLQPVLARPGVRPGEWELVFGHRRLRAARKAGLAKIPALVRAMSDVEVLEAQLVENCQRQDIHPLDEADGYRRLHEDHGYAIEDLVAKVGKSRAYVYARMKLCALVAPARKAFLAGKLNPSTALQIARIPVPELQEQATKEITHPRYGDEPMSVRGAFDHIQRHYMLRLGEAPFKLTDTELLPEAGACSTCPKRTGNQRELFDDVKSADVCTDPKCYERKREAAWQRRVGDAEAEGRRALSEKEAKKVFHRYSDQVDSRSGLVDLDARCWEDPKNRTWRRLLGKSAPQVAITRDAEGKVHELVAAKDATKALKEKGHDFTRRTKGQADTRYAAEQRRRQEKARLEGEVRRRIHEALREKLAKLSGPADLTRQDLETIVLGLFKEIWAENQKRIFDLNGWEVKKPRYGLGNFFTALQKKTPRLPLRALTLLLMDLALARDASGMTAQATLLLAAARRYRVSPERIRKAVVAEASAKKKAGTKTKPNRSAKRGG